ncbi:hypothetical protein D9613_005588 [Agrocybe pediades]|uniref:Uncharacterized protein n=1 Tax=Agrocybe pediades TaxID=84607 RepID=A0A8H4QYT2_9AGAR|nr:hypothetical protein D9613_005588 [Agrocybe pediades]
MHPSMCLSRTPLIRFLGKRTWPSTPEAPHPHPAAPSEFKQRFPQFLEARNNSTSSPAKSSSKSEETGNIYNEFWEAPARFWKPRVRYIDEKEMDAIMSGGASSY